MSRLSQYFLNIRTRHIVGLIEVALAWAVGIGPKTAIPTGAMIYMETVLKVNHITFAAICFVCGIFLVFYSAKGRWYGLLTIPILFYIGVAFLRVVDANTNNFASTVLYAGLYVLILRNLATHED